MSRDERASPDYRARLEAASAELSPGRTFSYRRTFTDADLALFCGVTGDFNPLHLDDGYIAESWFERRLVPGLLTASMVTHMGGLIGFIARDMHFDFPAPVYIGDTVSCTMTVVERADRGALVMEASFRNQAGAEVLHARFSGIPSDVRLAR